MSLVEFVKMSISFHDFFISPCSEFRILKFLPINLKNCKSQWIGCYDLFGPIFYLHGSTRKQIEQLPLPCSFLENWCSSLSFTTQARYKSNTKYLKYIHKYFGASNKLKPTRTIFSQCAQNIFNEIFNEQIMVKANIKPIFNTDMTILRTLYSFLLFFLCFSIKKFVQSKEKKHVLLEFFFFFLTFFSH